MNIVEPTNNFQYAIYTVGAVLVLSPAALYFVYLKFGNKKGSKDVPCISREERNNITRHGELLQLDHHRIQSLETGVAQLWQLNTRAAEERRIFAERIIGDIGEIKGEIKGMHK